MSETDYPLLAAQTGKFRRGVPRNFKLASNAHAIAFLRAKDGFSAKLDLWVVRNLDSTPREQLLIDTDALNFDDGELSPKEKARRERLRESGAGITQFSSNSDLSIFVFPLSGSLFIWQDGKVRQLGDWNAVVDPQLDPSGKFVAFTSGQDFIVCSIEGDEIVRIAAESETVTYGLADFIASEELSRYRGHWWSPDGTRLLVQRTDESPVAERWISDPTNPEVPPRMHRYPQAGTENAEIELLSLSVASKDITRIWKSSEDIPYLASVGFSAQSGWFTTLNRHQQRLELFKVENGVAVSLHTEEDDAWIDCGIGLPQLCLHDVLVSSTVGKTRDVFIEDRKLEFGSGHIQEVLSVTEDAVIFSAYTNPWNLVLFKLGKTLENLSDLDGWATGVFDRDYALISQSRPDRPAQFLVKRNGETVYEIASNAVVPPLKVSLNYFEVTERSLPLVVLWPEQPVTEKLPIIVNIYGGPHHSEVIAAEQTFYDDQWLASQGFCVVVIDNAGTPGKGPAWEREVYLDLSEIILKDQVAALKEICSRFSDKVDESRVGIAGWSFGGYLSALAVLDRPDVYKAAWAGAPVTDWQLYDTAYTERYLSHPKTNPDVYQKNSLIHRAHKLSRPLTLVHGLADDNVLAAHSLQLSRALLAQGKAHNFLPLAGVSHMTPQEDITKNLMNMMLNFFKDHLSADEI